MRILGCWYTHFDPLNLDRDRALLGCSLRSVEKMAASCEKCEPVNCNLRLEAAGIDQPLRGIRALAS